MKLIILALFFCAASFCQAGSPAPTPVSTAPSGSLLVYGKPTAGFALESEAYQKPFVGACRYTEDLGTKAVAGLNLFQFNGSKFCGVCLKVTGAKGSVVVKVVDACEGGCSTNGILLPPSIFQNITGNLKGDRQNVTYTPVRCAAQANLVFKFEQGSNKDYLGVQVYKIPVAIEKLSLSSNSTGEKFIELKRTPFNLFETYSAGPGPFTFMVTYVDGTSTTVSNVILVPGNVFPTRTPTRTPTATRTRTPSKAPKPSSLPVTTKISPKSR